MRSTMLANCFFSLRVSAIWIVLLVCGSQLGLAQAVVSDATPDIDFGRDVRQILSDKCFLCHGPDDATREAGLRLDLREEAHAFGAIDPDSPSDSELLTRIRSTDPDVVMPPPETGKSISADEAQILEKWIEQGANYSEHWAFVAPTKPSVPQVSDPSWVRNPIDNFVLAKIDQQGLSPSLPAAPETLVRRLYLDLIGLPPSVLELEAAIGARHAEGPVAKHGPELDDVVEQLVESPHFGERWARWWLDAARYADSDGYEKDKPRDVWFYRDWVIQAMNTNMPYDQFVVEQIAGDLLPGATQSQKVATGFLRNSMVNEEGGADPEQFRVEGMFDRVDAIGKSILGITTQCAQCHTHKYDPLSHAEYYQMFAALNDFHESTLTVFTPEQAAQRDRVLQKIAAIESDARSQIAGWQQRLRDWEDRVQDLLVPWQTLVSTDIPYEGQKFRVLDDGSILSESYAPTKTSNTFTLTTTADKISAFRIDVLTHPQLPRGGPGRSIYGTGALTEFEVKIEPVGEPEKSRSIKFVRALADVNPSQSKLPAAFRNKDAAKDDRVTGPIEYAFDDDAKTAWSTDNGPGRRNQSRHAIFVPETPIENEGEVVLSLTLKQNHGGWNSDDNQNYLLGRYRFSMTDAPIGEHTLPSDVEAILLTTPGQRTELETQRLFSYWLTTQHEYATTASEIEMAWSEFPESSTQLVVESLGSQRDTYVLARGNFLDKLEPVEAGTPGFLGGMEPSVEPARLSFARWLVRDDAPTTARVIVNRIWQAYFAVGIVATPEDFGLQSAYPSHPDLLDWLAVELVEHDWDLRHIHRLIVDSATYRQSSRVSETQADRDPQNQWLARGPRFRVDAEVVRDSALKISGLLNPALGGPSIYPPAPEFLFEPPASYGPKIWDTNQDDGQFRRSLYVHAYRSVPYPALQVFDAPKADTACIRRERSNTPLQALVLLNEPQFVDCARAFATRILRESPSASNVERMRFAHRMATGRIPEPREVEILAELLESQQDRVQQGELGASEMFGVSAVTLKQLTGFDESEVLPWFIVARTLLNLDETITKP